MPAAPPPQRWAWTRDVVSVSKSRSRDGLETHQRLVSVSAIYVSCPRCYFRPNYASHINKMSQISSRYLWQNPRLLVFVTTTTTTTTNTQGCGVNLDVSVSRQSQDAQTSRLGLVSVSGFNVSCPSLAWTHSPGAWPADAERYEKCQFLPKTPTLTFVP